MLKKMHFVSGVRSKLDGMFLKHFFDIDTCNSMYISLECWNILIFKIIIYLSIIDVF